MKVNEENPLGSEKISREHAGKDTKECGILRYIYG